ncbi:MAG: cation diffusion facilitator family transporter [Candidatus Latescibacterota bacterium]
MATHLEERTALANRVTWTGLAMNVILTLFKLAAGIFGSSQAMLADAFNSLSDFATDIVVLLGFSIVRKPADHDHQYGHGKVETLITVIIGLAILGVGFQILISGGTSVYRILRGEIPPSPEWITLVAAVFAIVIKEWLYRFTVRAGRSINSPALMAKAWDHRSDALSSTGVLIGITGAILLGDRWTVLDPLAAIVVSIFIMRVAARIILTGVNDLLEVSLGDETERNIREIIENVPGILNAHDMKTRRIGNAIAIDTHIEVDRSLSIEVAHDIATTVENRIRDAYGPDTVVNVHMEPR